MDSPAEQLTKGYKLPNGWTIVRRMDPPATGGCFSTGYLVCSEDGHEAFLKALDFSRAFEEPDVVAEMHKLTSAFKFERDLLDRCRKKHFRRVAYAIEYNEATLDPSDLYSKVPYLIFDRADGDIRRVLDAAQSFDLAWLLRSIHHIATGFSQLHSLDIAHQDLKPSNVLIYDGKASKVADLGRASVPDDERPHDKLLVAGDPRYAPPELLYRDPPADWKLRRLGCDLYHLASYIYFLFTEISLTAAIQIHLPEEHRWSGRWNGSYRDVLPYIQASFADAMTDLAAMIPSSCRDSLTNAVMELGDPDPSRRGHPINHKEGANQFDLRRYVSLFDLLAQRAEAGLEAKILA